MNLLGAILYDPVGAVSKITTGLLAMTAFDTTNLRLTVTVPAHGLLLFKLRCCHHGATTSGQHLLGVRAGATVVGRVGVLPVLLGTAVATTQIKLEAEFIATGLAAGSTAFDAAYGVEIVSSAGGAIKYGGPNDTTTNNAFGAFMFEIWDPRPLQVSSQPLQIDSNGRIDIGEVLGTAIATPATAGIIDVNVKNMNNVAGTAITTVKAVQGLTAADTIATYTGNTPQTGDVFPLAATEIADIKAKTDQLVFTVANQVDSNVLTGGGSGLDAAATRAALGLASANLDTQLTTIDDFLDTEVAAIKAKTDQFVFTVANQVDANALTGGGSGLDAAATRAALGLAAANLDTQLDALPTNAELATSQAAADDATLAAIAAVWADTRALTVGKFLGLK